MEQPSYYAVIPANVRYAKIPDGAKLLYGEITALSSKEGYCWASNAYFGELYGVQPNTISVWVTTLKEQGFVVVSLEKNSLRKITLTHHEKSLGGSRKIVSTPNEKSGTSIKDSITTNTVAIAPDLIEVREDEKPKKTDAVPKDPNFLTLCRWAETRRGFEFLEYGPQFAALSRAKAKDISITRLKDRWGELENEDWRTGLDWKAVVSSFNSRA